VPIDPYHRQLAARIREIADRKKMSLNRLADFADISRSHLGRILRGQSPKVSTLRKIAAALDVSTRDLLPPTG
jgi:transcriptional regulator with XRE-family HTH domain